ncbi:conserved hypothetical protein [Candidatus Magnetomoraceae bacterium gMMP-15]
MKLNTTQKHIFFRLLFTGEKPMISKVKPKLSPKLRKEMIDEGLIELEKRGRVQHIMLTDKAWQWAADNIDDEIPVRLKLSPDILQGLLSRVKKYIDSHDISLPELLGFINVDNEYKQKEENLLSPEQQIRNAYLEISKGKFGVRVKLSALRKLLPDIGRSELDDLIEKIEKQRKIILYTMNDLYNITPEDEKAAISFGDIKRHIIYMEE